MKRASRLVGLLVITTGGVIHAAPLATASVDLDGDGTAEVIELTAEGRIRIGGARPAELRLAPDATRGAIAIAHTRGAPQLVIELERVGRREGIVLEARGGTWREVIRVPIGPVGDGEHGIEIDATPDGVFRYQTRGGLRRCDGRPAYLFAERLDGATFRRPSRLPSGVPATAAVLPARAGLAGVDKPGLYQARLASVQPGVSDARFLALPVELDDGQLDTGWTEELVGSAGEGQFFTFEPRVAGVLARQVRIVPGRPTSRAAMRAVNRPRELYLVAASGAWRVELPDAAAEPLGTAYTIELPTAVAGCVTVILGPTFGPPRGTTAIAELQVFAEGERTGGADAMLTRIVADGADGAVSAEAVLARRGAGAVAALDAALAQTREAAARRRLVLALTRINDPAVAPVLARAATERWVTGPTLLELVRALGDRGLVAELAALALDPRVDLEARMAAAGALPATGPALDRLVALAGAGPAELRRIVIARLALAPVETLVAAVQETNVAPRAGDLWRAITRRARAQGGERPAALTSLLAALASTTDYERRYRLVDGVATLGDAAALRTLARVLAALPPGGEAAALRQVAIAGTTALPRPEAASLVIGLAADPDPGVRLAAVRALASLGTDAGGAWHLPDGPDAIDRVIATALSADRWPEVRRRAAEALGARCQRGGPARALFAAVTADADLGVRGEALGALVACRATGIAALLPRVWDDGKAPLELRMRAVGLTVALENPTLAGLLLPRLVRWRGAALESADALALAQSATAALARLAPPGATQALVDGLDDVAFPELVTASALGLELLGPRCPPAARARLQVLARSDEPYARAAARAAAACGR